jgi:hypothetical protein
VIDPPYEIAASALPRCGHRSHFLFVRALAHCWNALTASVGIEKVRAPARVVTVSVRPRDICSARWKLGIISRPERPRYSRLVDYWLVAIDLQLDQFIVGPLCRFVGIGEEAERYDLEQAETKRGDAPVVVCQHGRFEEAGLFVRITWRDGKLFDDRAVALPPHFVRIGV